MGYGEAVGLGSIVVLNVEGDGVSLLDVHDGPGVVVGPAAVEALVGDDDGEVLLAGWVAEVE